jgi:hypothetical protein
MDSHSFFQVVYLYRSREETKMLRVRLKRFYVSSGIMTAPIPNCVAYVRSYIHYTMDPSRKNRARRTVHFQNKNLISSREIVCRQGPQKQESCQTEQRATPDTGPCSTQSSGFGDASRRCYWHNSMRPT